LCFCPCRLAPQLQEYADEFPEEAEAYLASKKTKQPRKTKESGGAKRAKGKAGDETPSRKRKASSSSSSGKKKSKGKGRLSDDEEDEEEEEDEDEEDEDADDEAEFEEDHAPSTPSRRAKTVQPKKPDTSKGTAHGSKARHTPSASAGTTDQPPVVVLDPHLTNTRAAKVVSSLKGIKQSDLPDSENITKAVTVSHLHLQ
jgi:hypothetical protein